MTVAVVVAVALIAWLVWGLPQAAHRAFLAGRCDRARRRYQVLRLLAVTARRRRAAALSLAACDLADGNTEAAIAQLDRIRPVEPDERAVWCNNRATAWLDRGDPPSEALSWADEASALRPDVPAIVHTRARALLACDRVDEAIGALDGMRAAGELAPRLEAERCRDLAIAWDRKGHSDYAADYRARAGQLGPSIR